VTGFIDGNSQKAYCAMHIPKERPMTDATENNVSNGPAERLLKTTLDKGIDLYKQLKSDQKWSQDEAGLANKSRIKYGLLLGGCATLTAVNVVDAIACLAPAVTTGVHLGGLAIAAINIYGAALVGTSALRSGVAAREARNTFKGASKEAEILGHQADGAERALRRMGATTEQLKVEETPGAAKPVSRVRRMFGR
jgi:hypothetical protein